MGQRKRRSYKRLKSEVSIHYVIGNEKGD